MVCVCLCVQAFGIVVKVSDGILGITLLAWGNSIGGIYLHLLHSTMRVCWCLCVQYVYLYRCCG